MNQGVAIGVVLMLAAQVIMPVNDAVAKHLVSALPVIMVAWSRFFFIAVWLVPLVAVRHGSKLFRVAKPWWQVARGLVIVSANILFVSGVRHIPLADALDIVFIAPLAVAALSAKFLDEPVSLMQWSTIALGFVGAIVIIRPGFSGLSLAALLPLGAGLLYAVYLVLSRYLASSAPPDVTLAMTAITGGCALSLALPFVWVTPDSLTFCIMMAVGVLSGLGHLCITSAHVHAPASLLAPITYLSIVTAAILAYAIFGDVPDLWTWIGAGIVIVSGIFLWSTQSRTPT